MDFITLCWIGVFICIFLFFAAMIIISCFSMNAKMGKTRIIQDGNGKFVVQMVQHHSWDWEGFEKPAWLPVSNIKHNTLEAAQKEMNKIRKEVKKKMAGDIIAKVFDDDPTMI